MPGKFEEADSVESIAEPSERPTSSAPEQEGTFVDGVCPVVGIGASAGGLEAFTQLLQHLPANTGMAFVLVQHLDPRQESILSDILSGHTRMPVQQAAQGTRVAPNQVFVIPPNARMAIHNGFLQLTPRSEDRTRNLPIDHFLCSLAEEHKSLAIGVILSGSASDGTIGMQAIKAEGGITFAQDETAKFDGMPRNAIAANVVDFILPPAAIAQELANISRHSYLNTVSSAIPEAEGLVLRKLLSILRQSSGVDFTHYKIPTIQRRTARRMALKKVETLEEYVSVLQNSPEETDALFDDLLIGVTEFFRDPATFTILSQKVFPAILKNHKPEQAIRIWVPGCSSGEEVYSLAICLAEYLESTQQAFPVQIFGTDLSERAIQSARAGKYSAQSVASVSPERRDRFFELQDHGNYRIARPLRELCVFSQHDLTKDPPLSKMDLISCRNLLIYFGLILQKRVMVSFNHALLPTGFLLLGASENVGSLSEHFLNFDQENKIFVRNLQLPQPSHDVSDVSASGARGLKGEPNGREDAAVVLDREADRLVLDQYGPSGLVVNGENRVLKFRGKVQAYLSPPTTNLTLDVLSLIREDLVLPLRAAIDEARKKDAVVRKSNISIMRDERLEVVDLVARPMSKLNGDQHLLILFEEGASRNGKEADHKSGGGGGDRPAGDLSEELASTRAYLQSLVEELRTANEETQSTNEELQSTNEELQTAKEELQSTNEELVTTNDEMKSRNAELGQTNYDLLNLLSSLQVPIVMLTKDLRVRRFTPLAQQSLNLIPTDVGRPILDLRPQIEVPNLGDLLSGVVEAQRPYEQEVRDVAGRWYSLRITPYWAGESRAEGAVLQLIDIDELKRTLESIEFARNYSEAIYSTVREPLLVLDSELTVHKANRSFFETFQAVEDETLNRKIFQLGGGQWDLPRVREMLTQALASPEGYVADVEVERDFPRIGWRTFQLNARVLRRDGGSSQVLLALADISDRKRAAEAKYRRLFETAKDGMVLLDAQTGNITDLNPFVVETFGYTREELRGNPFWKVAPLRGIPGGERALQRIRTEKVVRFADLPLETKEGRQIDSEIVANVYDEGGKEVIQLNMRDITERKHFERQLRESAKMESLGVLAGGVAHDFNNLLTGIMGNASLMLDDLGEHDPNRVFLREIVKASQQAAGLTRQMLAYSGRGRFLVGPLNLSDLVREVSTLVRSSIPRSVELHFALAANPPSIQGDEMQIQQLVMNLVINAGEAIGENGHGFIRVSTRVEQMDLNHVQLHFAAEEFKPGEYLMLEVADSGVGMDEATKAKIFDPFFTTKFTGRGLGLAAALGIVKGHCGAIRVYSQPGRGTTFTVFFPVSAKTVEAPPAQETPQDLRGHGTVLLVDDEEMVIRMGEAALFRSGYTVLTASNGLAAVKIIHERGADLSLMILDLTMPVMGGEETLAKTKKIRPELPIILSSGYDESQAVRRFGERDLAGFIQKPYNVTKLLQAVKAALK